MRYDVQPDDRIAKGRVFVDLNEDEAPGNPDGMKSMRAEMCTVPARAASGSCILCVNILERSFCPSDVRT
jgi:hypothetical protein